MNVIDIVIVLMILLCGVIGMHRGFFKELVITAGAILVLIIAFKLKDPIAEWLSLNLPFFQFAGSFKGVTVINILLYHLIAFIAVLAILMTIFGVVLTITGIFEKLLDITIILGIPSKILGFLLGLVEGYVIMFILVFIFSQPMFNWDLMSESKLGNKMLQSTPVLNEFVSNVKDSVDEIYGLKDKFSSDSKKDEFNREAVDIMLKYNVIQTDYVQKLVNAGKLKISGIDDVLKKYE